MTPNNLTPSVAALLLTVAITATVTGSLTVANAQAVRDVEVFPAYRRPVTIWVPPYAVEKCRALLMPSTKPGATESTVIEGVAAAVTHLALQFWAPTSEGGVKSVRFREVTDGAITALRDYAHQRGVRTMLCLFNGETKWDWPQARAAFTNHQEAFIKNIVAEMNRWGLDGVDIDLEGPGSFEIDMPAFISFIRSLSTRLHDRAKQITVDSFAYIWNAPNQSWWNELLPLVDGLTTMGYEETGLGAAAWAAYPAQKLAAGKYASKLQIGMPSHKDSWCGNTVLEQLRWVLNDGTVGVAIWDAQLTSPAWKTPEVWRTVGAISGRVK